MCTEFWSFSTPCSSLNLLYLILEFFLSSTCPLIFSCLIFWPSELVIMTYVTMCACMCLYEVLFTRTGTTYQWLHPWRKCQNLSQHTLSDNSSSGTEGGPMSLCVCTHIHEGLIQSKGVWFLQTQLESSVRAGCSLNHWAISLAIDSFNIVSIFTNEVTYWEQREPYPDNTVWQFSFTIYS